ncbi:alpha/beta hydrolase [Corynebacterium diphtheriae]|uniref:alpha/beta hydrolase n=1 Tax=Corynebacterium diphtheriae TaxID=1717 RepID=UPI00217EEA83|nr:alpha/beta hydrolase [Corynebacterium diphtheriae]MCS6571728.1 lysophospholipase [Corynebacterium diphtheriae]
MTMYWHHTSTTPVSTVLITHGYAEHQGRYSALVRSLLNYNFDVVTFDLPGHGYAPGPRACVDVDKLVDFHVALRHRAEQDRRLRTETMCLFGHSMGGLITALSVLEDSSNVSAVALSGPAFSPFPKTPRVVTRMLRCSARIAPRLKVLALPQDAISRDPEVVAAYANDPRNYTGRVPLLTGASMALAGQKALAQASQWDRSVPLLVMHGSADRLADIEGSRNFAASAGGTMRPVDGAFHEIFNEPEAPQLRAELCEWLHAHCGA